MTIRLPRPHNSFPRTEVQDVPANAWGSQWKHLPRAPAIVVRHAMRDGLRILRG
ncbi:hypothetical protein [Novosphingobium sp. 17-62-19]|uniref:hypothetical protein n=1 Tax=Novosphingobium sp. 17-62-19 TaxID=1970406 RepID=UPI0025FE2BAF|nr:hypothetical protein [Novosphingobium sp. 17-62-19]HQS96037.1 hypothetical protein [Novosphingobium sp.]